jgi:DNA-binding transcriptional ArsR family regulator
VTTASLDRVLTALADPYRRRAVELLRERPRRAGELAEALGLSSPAMSKHLRALRKAASSKRPIRSSTRASGSTR